MQKKNARESKWMCQVKTNGKNLKEIAKQNQNVFTTLLEKSVLKRNSKVKQVTLSKVSAFVYKSKRKSEKNDQAWPRTFLQACIQNF